MHLFEHARLLLTKLFEGHPATWKTPWTSEKVQLRNVIYSCSEAAVTDFQFCHPFKQNAFAESKRLSLNLLDGLRKQNSSVFSHLPLLSSSERPFKHSFPDESSSISPRILHNSPASWPSAAAANDHISCELYLTCAVGLGRAISWGFLSRNRLGLWRLTATESFAPWEDNALFWFDPVG